MKEYKMCDSIQIHHINLDNQSSVSLSPKQSRPTTTQSFNKNNASNVPILSPSRPMYTRNTNNTQRRNSQCNNFLN